ncbi:acetyltransferase [Paenibacillus oryzisoli]|uniref:acetyltransferase n=1 Tax=Paenibacillus oryzisoli TaxID=1850517 RepID=UPI003D2CD922
MEIKNVILIGYGGHAKVIHEILKKRSDIHILGYIDNQDKGVPLKWLGDDEKIKGVETDSLFLVLGIGYSPNSRKREKLYRYYKEKGYSFLSVIHDQATISEEAVLGEGVQIMAGAIIQPGVSILENVLVNTGAIIDHESRVHAHVHIAPRATLCGNVVINESVYVGAGAVIIQNIMVGQDSVIAAGATVVRNVESHSLMKGVPARKE